MNLKGIINVLIERYEANNGKKLLPAPYVVPLLAEPTDEQLKQLKKGDGNPIAEMCQINSSAGLAFNYYKLFESQVQKKDKDFKVKFEDKVAIPLCKVGRKYANLDVSYCLNGTQYYIESKFLEHYYNTYKCNTCSYHNEDNYGFSEETAEWLKLLKHEKEFQYYDFPQLYRHLLAIRRKHCNKEGKIVLQSVSWKMPDAFKEIYGLKQKDNELLESLEQEQLRACELFNDFLKKIGWDNCSFEVKHYNDMLDDIRNAEKFDDFFKQYFLE